MWAVSHQFARRLRQLRVEQGLLQRELERALHLRPGAASQYERGLREPGMDLLIAIADHFGVTLDYLVGRTGAPDRPESPKAGRPLLDSRFPACNRYIEEK